MTKILSRAQTKGMSFWKEKIKKSKKGEER